MSISSYIREQLAQANLKSERMREIINRLLAQGVIVRDQDKTEQQLYDDARRIETLLEDYFEVPGFYLHHDSNNQFYRLYAPGAEIEGVNSDTDVEPVPSLRARVSTDFVAAALALRFLYQNKLHNGDLQPQGDALIGLEELAATMQTQLKRPLPSSNTDKLSLLAELRRHRLLAYSSTFSLADEDALLSIRPTITGIVSNEALATALEGDGVLDAGTEVLEETE